MLGAITFDFPLGWLAAVPAAAALGLAAWRQHGSGLSAGRILTLVALRSLALLPLICLAARPVWMAKEPPASASRPVMLLVDRSESMSLQEPDESRYQRALSFVRTRLLPSLNAAKLPVQAMLFDQGVEAADGAKLDAAATEGKRTNLGGAIAQALSGAAEPPLAVIALTDGMANVNSDNTRALMGLVEARVPFIGVGFGGDQGVRTLSLREVEAPAAVSTRSTFSVSAQVEVVNGEGVPDFELLFYRDAQLLQHKSVSAGKGSRSWLEHFTVAEEQPGVHNYSVQLLPPSLPGLKCVNLAGSAAVRVSDEKELRVLYIQGALTWDYKFVNQALKNDQTMKLTGLTRTSKQSVFRQNVENAGELMNGFPTSLEELAPFRVVVLSNLRPTDLTPAQQEVLARFCGELGGGLLLIGGPATFDGSWQHSRLEQLLPVTFAGNAGVQGLDRPFRAQLTEEAMAHPVFQIVDNHAVREAWGQLPTFTQYGRVDSVKPGAQVWMVHQTEDGPHGRRVLMACQRYGAGLSAVLSIQNFWRWRLARDADPQQFDRFWRQLFRFLSEVGRLDVAIHLADQELHPQMDVQVELERQPNPKNITDTNRKFVVQAQDNTKRVIHEEAVMLDPLRPVSFSFYAEKAGLYTVSVLDSLKAPISTRSIEIRELNLELQNTARNMETLRQWAAVSGGLAFKAEECPDGANLVAQIRGKIEEVRQGPQQRRMVGVNGWVLALVLAGLCGEWILRKKWSLA